MLSDLEVAGFSVDVERTIREWQEGHLAAVNCRGVRVDWLDAVLPAFQRVLAAALSFRIGTGEVRVASTEGLALMKLIAFREQDQVDVKSLLRVAENPPDLAWVRAGLEEIFEEDDPRFMWLDEAESG